MSQPVSEALLREQLQPTQQYYRHVELMRRYWNGSSYSWDTAINIDAYVVKVGTAKWRMESGAQFEFKSPSFSVEMDNRRNLLATWESQGLWQTGANAPYVPELSRIRVRTGHVLEDGTEEDVYVFGGVIGRPWRSTTRRTRPA